MYTLRFWTVWSSPTIRPMCGRYLLYTPPDDLRRSFSFTRIQPNLEPRFNIAPTQNVTIVRRNRAGRELTIIRQAEEGAERELVAAAWRLIPAWAKEPSIGNKMINARAETVSERPAFRAAFRSRRCI